MEPLPVHKAACAALQVFLQARFNELEECDPRIPSQQVVVTTDWAEPGQELPPRSVVILCAGTRKDTRLIEEVMKRVNKTATSAEFTWSVKAFEQPLQLEALAMTSYERDLINRHLDRFLEMGPLFTLGAGDIVRDGPLLELDAASGHEGRVDFTFDGPRDINDPVAAGEYQYRTIRSGQVDGELTFTATTARLALLKLQVALGEGASKPLTNITLQKNADGDAWELASAAI